MFAMKFAYLATLYALFGQFGFGVEDIEMDEETPLLSIPFRFDYPQLSESWADTVIFQGGPAAIFSDKFYCFADSDSARFGPAFGNSEIDEILFNEHLSGLYIPLTVRTRKLLDSVGIFSASLEGESVLFDGRMRVYSGKLSDVLWGVPSVDPSDDFVLPHDQGAINENAQACRLQDWRKSIYDIIETEDANVDIGSLVISAKAVQELIYRQSLV
ncbi:MAG: hypothetical protein LBJ89_04005 [Holosporales bacterium]|jgi:hypothetical protein|nr:hypothetical protein [Holosporales bacterium]